MSFTPFGKWILDAVDGRQLVIAIYGQVVMEGACENRDGVGDMVVWRDGGMNEL